MSNEQEACGNEMDTIIRLVDRNADALIARRKADLEKRSLAVKIADRVADFAGSVTFLYLHVVWFLVWIVMNTGVGGLPVFDKYPYGLLTMVVSLEAIFLSTFLLISSNRLARVAEERANLDLHINLLAEHEISRVLRLVDAIAEKMGIEGAFDPESEGLEQDTRIEDLLAELQDRG